MGRLLNGLSGLLRLGQTQISQNILRNITPFLGKRNFETVIPEHYKRKGDEVGDISRGFVNTRENLKEMTRRFSTEIGNGSKDINNFSTELSRKKLN